MARVYLSIGSNTRREQNIRAAVAALKELGSLRCSSVYQSPPIDGASAARGDDYYNLAVELQTSLPPGTLKDRLRGIEEQLGRDRSQPERVTVDIDLLLYDQLIQEQPFPLPHPDIRRYAHVLAPLAELAPSLVHPTEGCTLKAMQRDKSTGGNLQSVQINLH